jgi:hypothetical protein
VIKMLAGIAFCGGLPVGFIHRESRPSSLVAEKSLTRAPFLMPTQWPQVFRFPYFVLGCRTTAHFSESWPRITSCGARAYVTPARFTEPGAAGPHISRKMGSRVVPER